MEVKFRAWDKKSKKMRKVNSIAFNNAGSISVVNLWGYDAIEQKDIIINLNSEEKLKRVALLQYTGLRDKNNREIYKGDILEFEYSKMGFVIKLYGHVVSSATQYVIQVGDDVFDLFENYSKSEKIGNIYENAKLLSIK